MIIGWDVGGAHLKAALVEDGLVRDVVQQPCTLWLGLEHVDRALQAIRARWPHATRCEHAVTMTGEMVDLFADRAQGVAALAGHLAESLGPRVRFFAGSRWLDATQAAAHWQDVASANWRATAAWVARTAADALLVDVGSTTTDLVPVVGHAVAARGATDAQRLQSGELAYHGVVRTPVCALTQRVRFRGIETGIMNEWFATTADVYRLTGELDPAYDQHETADRRGKDPAATCARLARMIGRDGGDADLHDWVALARELRAAQIGAIERNARDVVAAARVAPQAPVVAAGCGDFLALELAQRLQRPALAFDRLLRVRADAAHWTRVCAPSVAVALLLAVDRRRDGVAEAVCGS
jgi:probable H4MPT-linked C1 transfer pathway protein